MSEPMIEIRGLSKSFTTEAETLVVLDGLDLDIAAASSLAIMGPSGSGKSTLLSLLGGLDRPSSGSLKVGGLELSALSEKALTEYRGRTLGFVFQAHYLLKDFSALENVALPAYMSGLGRKAAFERAADILGEVGLAARLGHLPSQLSGGERQRAALARALVNRPALLLADEPTGNLDAANAAAVRDLLYGLPARLGTTLVVVTHDPAMAEAAGRRLELRDGRLGPL